MEHNIVIAAEPCGSWLASDEAGPDNRRFIE
ncbi:hypothetical protein EDF87_106117 [Pseudomonas helmanticensis]|uniref:Uncharacterized protein n=1 Tax=Pseudomonas helmanticensis TaxID=1471381 RepID=A0A4R7VEQ2_9PSED|nr:hypothetical protein EDF87_106117 [Pseudomonas helmanticensis]